jgi:hypothetical protein
LVCFTCCRCRSYQIKHSLEDAHESAERQLILLQQEVCFSAPTTTTARPVVGSTLSLAARQVMALRKRERELETMPYKAPQVVASEQAASAALEEVCCQYIPFAAGTLLLATLAGRKRTRLKSGKRSRSPS